MAEKEYAEKTRELVVASDQVLFAMKQWKGNPTTENHLALLSAKIEYLESEITLGMFLRERLAGRIKAIEEQVAQGGLSKRKNVRLRKRAGK